MYFLNQSNQKLANLLWTFFLFQIIASKFPYIFKLCFSGTPISRAENSYNSVNSRQSADHDDINEEDDSEYSWWANFTKQSNKYHEKSLRSESLKLCTIRYFLFLKCIWIFFHLCQSPFCKNWCSFELFSF